jgi:hypothetical protein
MKSKAAIKTKTIPNTVAVANLGEEMFCFLFFIVEGFPRTYLLRFSEFALALIALFYL